MDERCRRTHAKLLAGICPWCGQPIIAGRPPEARTTSTPTITVAPPAGISLRELVARDGPLNVYAAAQHIEDLARQLQVLHFSEELHRSVCPDQVFVDRAGIARLADSSASWLVDAPTLSLSTEAEQAILGSADFLAPEAALQRHSIDARSDIYSLGCTMYFMLTGRPPFPNGSISERLLKHQTAIPGAIQSLRAEVPIGLVSICEKMLAKKPSERFQTAKDVGDAIAAWRINLNQTDL